MYEPPVDYTAQLLAKRSDDEAREKAAAAKLLDHYGSQAPLAPPVEAAPTPPPAAVPPVAPQAPAGPGPVSAPPSAGVGGLRRSLSGIKGAMSDYAADADETKGLYDRALDEQSAALNRQADAQEKQNDLDAAHLATQAKMGEELAQQNESRRADYLAARDRTESSIAAAEKDLAGTKIDPNRLMGDNVVAQVGAAIGMAMGAFGSSMTGTRNHAADIINNAITRDIQAQRDAKNSKARALAEKRRGLDKLRQRYGDDTQYDLAQHSLQLGAVQKKIESTKLGLKSEVDRAKLDELQSQVGMQRAGVHEKLAQSEFSAEMQGQTALAGVRGQVAHIQAANQAAAAKAAGGRRQAAAAKAAGGRRGKTVGSADVRSIGEFSSAIESTEQLLGDWENANSYLAGVSQYMPWPTESKKYNDKRAVAAQMVGSILEGGKLTEEDYNRYYDMLPNPGDSEERAKNKIASIKTLMRGRRNAGVKALNQAGYDASGLVDQTGQISNDWVEE